MDKINLLVTVSVISSFISLFLSFFLFTVKTKHTLSNRLFSVFLILTTIDISGVFFDSLNQMPSNIGMFRNLITFLQLPTFYLYVLSVCFYDFKLKTKHLIHIRPFIIANLVLYPRFYAVNLNSKIGFLQNNSGLLEIKFTHILLHIQIVAYIIAVFILLRKAKKLYLENYAGTSIKSLNWLFEFSLALTFFYSIALLKNVFKFTDYPDISEWLKIGLFVFELIIISWYLFKALNNPELFRTIDSKLKLVSDIILEEKKNESPTENVKELDSELMKLRIYMEEKKPFLNPSLTIQNISDEIEIPVRDLSLLINHKLGQHFFDFINTYRIEYAMTILKDGTRNKETILEILYEVGFNSKSSFNTAFKKHTDFTPTEYRKKLQFKRL